MLRKLVAGDNVFVQVFELGTREKSFRLWAGDVIFIIREYQTQKGASFPWHADILKDNTLGTVTFLDKDMSKRYLQRLAYNVYERA